MESPSWEEWSVSLPLYDVWIVFTFWLLEMKYYEHSCPGFCVNMFQFFGMVTKRNIAGSCDNFMFCFILKIISVLAMPFYNLQQYISDRVSLQCHQYILLSLFSLCDIHVEPAHCGFNFYLQINKKVGHFLYLFDIHISSSLKWKVCAFYSFSKWVAYLFLLFSFKSSLSILETSPWSNMEFENIFSQ